MGPKLRPSDRNGFRYLQGHRDPLAAHGIVGDADVVLLPEVQHLRWKTQRLANPPTPLKRMANPLNLQEYTEFQLVFFWGGAIFASFDFFLCKIMYSYLHKDSWVFE